METTFVELPHFYRGSFWGNVISPASWEVRGTTGGDIFTTPGVKGGIDSRVKEEESPNKIP